MVFFFHDAAILRISFSLWQAKFYSPTRGSKLDSEFKAGGLCLTMAKKKCLLKGTRAATIFAKTV